MSHELFGRRYFDEPPNWKCPNCHTGTLVSVENGQKSYEHEWSAQAHQYEAWDPDWIRGSFYWVLQCASKKCGHRVIVTGEFVVDFDIEDTDQGPSQVFKEFFEPNGFSDAPPIIQIQEFCPAEVSEHLYAAFSLFWVDPASCLNKLRQCIEDILTIEKVRRFSTKNGKRNPLSLHSRIEEYKKANKEAGEYLMALKWLGNEGSHSNRKKTKIERSHLIEAFEIMEYSLEIIFSSKKKVIGKKAKSINKKKGL